MKVVIIGGVAGGASCAARLRRLDENIEIARAAHIDAEQQFPLLRILDVVTDDRGILEFGSGTGEADPGIDRAKAGVARPVGHRRTRFAGDALQVVRRGRARHDTPARSN